VCNFFLLPIGVALMRCLFFGWFLCAPILVRAQLQAPSKTVCTRGSKLWRSFRDLDVVDDIPDDLVTSLRQGKCAAMVGAGLSYPAGLPGYEELLRTVASTAGVALEVPQNGSYSDLDAVQFQLAQRVGKEQMCSIMEKQLFMEKPFKPEANAVLAPFCSLPFAAVVSWNWDNLLDDSYRLVPNNSSGFAAVLDGDASPHSQNSSKAPLLKMQGDLRNSSTVMLTQEDYKRRQVEAVPFLQHFHQAYAVLHVGMSLRGGGVEGAKRPGLNFAILNDVTPRRRQELMDMNIRAISYDSGATLWRGNQAILEELVRRLVCIAS